MTMLTAREDYVDLRDLDEDEEAIWRKAFEEAGIAFDPDNEPSAIADREFENHAQELAEDIGLIDGKQVDWPYRHIDWEAAAEELKMDYCDVEVEGVTYWVRAC